MEVMYSKGFPCDTNQMITRKVPFSAFSQLAVAKYSLFDMSINLPLGW
jgi:hypothetical protein